jgi:hypothetical protein
MPDLREGVAGRFAKNSVPVFAAHALSPSLLVNSSLSRSGIPKAGTAGELRGWRHAEFPPLPPFRIPPAIESYGHVCLRQKFAPTNYCRLMCKHIPQTHPV